MLGILGLAGLAGAAEVSVAPGDLAQALAQATPGTTLRLLEGVHHGNFTISSSIRLVGDPGAIIEGKGQGTVLHLTADGISLSALEVRGSGEDLFEDDAVILLTEIADVTIEHCRIGARAFGIYLRGGGDHHIVDNDVHGDRSLKRERRGNGIHLWRSERNEIRDNRLVDVRDGVYLSFAHDNRIVGNQGSDLRYGIHYMYSERNSLLGNRFSNCTGGIALMFSMRNRIEANEAVDNNQFGILCQQLEHSHVEGNHLVGNGRGFYVENSAGNQFVNNHLAANGVGVYLTAGSEANLFTANRFVGNLVQVFEDREGANAFSDQGRGNFWSDYAGFDWNGDGVGETPYRLRTAAAALMARRPTTRWFWMSPVLTLLDWWDAQMTASEIGSFDPFPLVGGVTLQSSDEIP